MVGMVSELVGTYEDGFEFYSKWRRKREKQNHYRKQRTGTRIYGYGAAACVDALSTSLNISGGKIKDVYDIGFSIIGQDFSRGDSTGYPLP